MARPFFVLPMNRLRNVIRVTVSAIPIGRFEVIALAGLALVSAGLHQVYPPAALIVPGTILFFVGVFGARGQVR